MSNLINVNSGTSTITATSTSSRVAYVNTGPSLRVTVSGSATVFVKSGDSSVVATTSDCPMLPSMDAVFSKSTEDTHIAVITTTGTSTVYAQSGSGS